MRHLAIVMALTACAGPNAGKHTLAATGVGMLAAGAVMRFVVAPASCSDDSSLGACLDGGLGGYYGGYSLMAVGALLALGSLAIVNNASETATPAPQPIAEAPPAPVTSPAAPPTQDPTLQDLTRQASLAARAGHCAAVQSIAIQVANLDDHYREDGFLTDRAILRCLQ